MKTAYIGLGSNEGDRVSQIREAVKRIGDLPDISVLVLSSLFETVPIRVPGGLFLNGVMAVATGMGPQNLLENLMRTESGMGRKRTGSEPESRNIDLDLLLYGDLVMRQENLIVPHPGILERRFVLEPLAEITPDLRIPLGEGRFSETVSILKERCREQKVVKFGPL